jgi:hypothetical protein
VSLKDKAAAAVQKQAFDEAAEAYAGHLLFYCPTLGKPSGFAAGVDTWALMLEGAVGAGWALHTWALLPDGSARPLFVRSFSSQQ